MEHEKLENAHPECPICNAVVLPNLMNEHIDSRCKKFKSSKPKKAPKSKPAPATSTKRKRPIASYVISSEGDGGPSAKQSKNTEETRTHRPSYRMT